MAQATAVHIELRDGSWSVVREGNKRATSTHATQSEAAEAGRNLARRDGTEFFLHGQDGQIREHRDYREEQTSTDEGILGHVGTVVPPTEAADGSTAPRRRHGHGPRGAASGDRRPADRRAEGWRHWDTGG